MDITIAQLEYLAAVAQTGSITAAADRLRRAKSAIYYSLKKLEHQVGFSLMTAGGHRSELTTQAIQLLRQAEPLLDAFGKLKDQAHQIATGAEALVSISVTAIYDLKTFNQKIKVLQSRFPNTEIRMHREILSGAKMLQSGLVDLALLEPHELSTGFEERQITTIMLHLVIAKDHPFFATSGKQQGLDRLFQYPQVIQRSTIPDDDQQGVYQQARRWTVSDLAAKRQIILDGLGWGRMPYHDIADDLATGRLVCLKDLEKPSPLPLLIARKKRGPHGPVAQAFWDMF